MLSISLHHRHFDKIKGLIEVEKMEMKKIVEEEDDQEVSVLQLVKKDIIKEIEMILQYRFREKILIIEAFTYSSFYNCLKKTEKSYGRLEILGDSVLACLMAMEVFHSYNGLTPGQLWLLKAANVDIERLAPIAFGSKLYRFIRHNAPQLEMQIKEFMEGMNHYPVHSNGLLDPPKALANIIESVIGAIFLNSSSCLETVWKISRKLKGSFVSLDTLGKRPLSELSESCQKNIMNVSFKKDTWMKSTTVNVCHKK